MFDISSLFAKLDMGFQGDIDDFDMNDDGQIDIKDCLFEPGTMEAKMWVKNVLEPSVENADIPDDVREQFPDTEIKGIYKGKPLIDGTGHGHGDFAYLRDRVMLTQGLDYQAATRVAGKVKYLIHG